LSSTPGQRQRRRHDHQRRPPQREHPRQTERERGIPPHWLPHFTVGNAEHAARRAERAGGRRLGPAAEIRTGRITVIADPQGASLAVFEGETEP